MKFNLLIGIVWLGLAMAALAIVYAAGSAIVWLIQQAIGLVWPVASGRPPGSRRCDPSSCCFAGRD